MKWSSKNGRDRSRRSSAGWRRARLLSPWQSNRTVMMQSFLNPAEMTLRAPCIVLTSAPIADSQSRNDGEVRAISIGSLRDALPAAGAAGGPVEGGPEGARAASTEASPSRSPTMLVAVALGAAAAVRSVALRALARVSSSKIHSSIGPSVARGSRRAVAARRSKCTRAAGQACD